MMQVKNKTVRQIKQELKQIQVSSMLNILKSLQKNEDICDNKETWDAFTEVISIVETYSNVTVETKRNDA